MRLAEQDEPQRGGVDRAVVGRERKLAGPAHLTRPELVQNLAGLRVAPVVDGGGLALGQDFQRLDRDPWREGDGLQRRDQRVAPEQRGEPGHAGGDEPIADRVGRLEQAQVVHGPPDDLVDQLVVGFDDRVAGQPAGVGVSRIECLRVEQADGLRRLARRVDGPADLSPFA